MLRQTYAERHIDSMLCHPYGRAMIIKAVIVAAALTAAAVPVASADPVAGCPTPYVLFAVPSDGSRPVAADLDARGNRDGYACEKPFSDNAASHVGAPYNVIDNRVKGK
jgi:hypothetical protein